jgi:hypothetical protein
MQNALASLGLVYLLGVTACPQPLPPVPPGPGPADAAPSTIAEATCTNLARLQCPEGLRPDCAAVVQKAIDTRITDLKLGCLAEAQTVDAVRACGSVTCN